jgi:hypothetical protein
VLVIISAFILIGIVSYLALTVTVASRSMRAPLKHPPRHRNPSVPTVGLRMMVLLALFSRMARE